jgi:hypothetical protein
VIYPFHKKQVYQDLLYILLISTQLSYNFSSFRSRNQPEFLKCLLSRFNYFVIITFSGSFTLAINFRLQEKTFNRLS